MEIIFIRHGQGEHTVDLPGSLQIQDLSLTQKGVNQAETLQSGHTNGKKSCCQQSSQKNVRNGNDHNERHKL